MFPHPMETATEYPRLMKIGTQVLQGMFWRFLKLFLLRSLLKQSEAKVTFVQYGPILVLFPQI